MLNMRYFDDRLPLERQAQLLERNRIKRLAQQARQAQTVCIERTVYDEPRRPLLAQLLMLPRLAFPWS